MSTPCHPAPHEAHGRLPNICPGVYTPEQREQFRRNEQTHGPVCGACGIAHIGHQCPEGS